MTLHDLANILTDMYENAPDNDSVAMIHLFGIKYANEIRGVYSAAEIIKASGLKSSYATELNKGIRLSKYVKLME